MYRIKLNIHLIIIAAVIMAAVLILALGNPHSLSWPLKCPLYWLTGWQCPLCGSQRAMHELLIGNVTGAWEMNPALLLSLPYLAVLFIGQADTGLQTKNSVVRWCYKNSTLFWYGVIMAVWGLVRNIL